MRWTVSGGSAIIQALRVPEGGLRLFGKLKAFARRRVGVALDNGKDIEEARSRAKLAASRVRLLRE